MRVVLFLGGRRMLPPVGVVGECGGWEGILDKSDDRRRDQHVLAEFIVTRLLWVFRMRKALQIRTS